MNTSSWWSTLANHGDDQLHWTLDKPNYPLYNSNYPLDQPNYPIDQVESWGQRVVWGVSICGWRGVLLIWESYFVLTAGISNSAHFIKVPTLYTQMCSLEQRKPWRVGTGRAAVEWLTKAATGRLCHRWPHPHLCRTLPKPSVRWKRLSTVDTLPKRQTEHKCKDQIDC